MHLGVIGTACSTGNTRYFLPKVCGELNPWGRLGLESTVERFIIPSKKLPNCALTPVVCLQNSSEIQSWTKIMKINVARIFETLKKDLELIFVKFSLEEVQLSCSKWIHPVLNGNLVDNTEQMPSET